MGIGLDSSINEVKRAITLKRLSNETPEIQTLLKHPYITFWGDLDSERIQILNSSKLKIPQLE